MITLSNMRPRIVPNIEPSPPLKLVPPIIAAAMTTSSIPEPADGAKDCATGGVLGVVPGMIGLLQAAQAQRYSNAAFQHQNILRTSSSSWRTIWGTVNPDVTVGQ